jgi:uncharacterized protein (DUF952 family)
VRLIYHLVPRAILEQAPPGPYRADSLASEGFIHCSNAGQVAWAANRFHAGTTDLLVLCIDPGRLAAPVRDEDAGSGECFPHIYGPIVREAVVEVKELTRGPDGRWQFPAPLGA